MKTNEWISRLVAVVSLLLLAESGDSATLEGFDYAGGSPIAGLNGGSGWSNAWAAVSGNGTLVIEDGSLTYPGIASTGGKLHFTGAVSNGTTTYSYRTQDTLLTTNQTYYISLLAQNLNEGRRYFGLALFNGSTEKALLGQGSMFDSWTLNHVSIIDGIVTNTLVSHVDSSLSALLLVKLQLLPGPENVTFWVNPDLSALEDPSTAVGGASYFTDNDYEQITRVRAAAGGYSATAGGNPTEFYLDEISISTESPFAVPEPATAVLFGAGVGALALIARRRIRRP